MFPDRVSGQKRQQQGFSLLLAIFLLVALATLGLTMTQNRNVQNATMVMSLQGARAVQAALSGLDLGIAEAINNGSCNASTVISLTDSGLNGFNVTVECSSVLHTELSTVLPVYQFVSTAEYSIYGDSDYVSRVIEAKVSPNPP